MLWSVSFSAERACLRTIHWEAMLRRSISNNATGCSSVAQVRDAPTVLDRIEYVARYNLSI